MGKPEENIPLEILRRFWEDNIKIDFKGTEWWDVDWFSLAQDTYTRCRL